MQSLPSFERTTLELDIDGDRDPPVRGVLEALVRPPTDIAPPNSSLAFAQKQLTLMLSSESDVRRILDGASRPVKLIDWGQTRSPPDLFAYSPITFRMMEIEQAAGSWTTSREFRIEYDVGHLDSRVARLSPRGGWLSSAAGFVPRPRGWTAFKPAPVAITLRWRTASRSGTLLGPGGAVEMTASPDGCLEGTIETPQGQVALNELVWGVYESTLKAEGVTVYGFSPSNERSGYTALLRSLLATRDVFERVMGPLPETVFAAEWEMKQYGTCLFPGVIAFPREITAPGANAEGRVTRLLAHELAHSYFGCGVFVTGFSEGNALLTEGVCEYLALVAMEEIDGDDVLQATLESMRREAQKVEYPSYTLDRWSMRMAHPRYVYPRGAYVFRMIESTIGRELLLSILRGLHREFQWKTMEPGAFYGHSEILEAWSAAERRGEATSWNEFLDSWIRSNEIPDVTIEEAKVRRFGEEFVSEARLRNSSSSGIRVVVDVGISNQHQSETQRVLLQAGEPSNVRWTTTWLPRECALDPERRTLSRQPEVMRVRLDVTGQ